MATINFNFDADSAANSYFCAGCVMYDDFHFTNNTGKELTFGLIRIQGSSDATIPGVSSSHSQFEGSNPFFGNSSEITLANGASQYINGYSGSDYLVIAYLNRYEPVVMKF